MNSYQEIPNFYIYGSKQFADWITVTEIQSKITINCNGGNKHWLYSFDKSNPTNLNYIDIQRTTDLPTTIISFEEFITRYSHLIINEINAKYAKINAKIIKSITENNFYSII